MPSWELDGEKVARRAMAAGRRANGGQRQVESWAGDMRGLEAWLGRQHTTDGLPPPEQVVQAAGARGLCELPAGTVRTAALPTAMASRPRREQPTLLKDATGWRLTRASLAIDDFGSGDSSLIEVRGVLFDELKWVRSGVGGVGRSATLRTMLEDKPGTARPLGQRAVDVGVEDRDNRDCLSRTSGDSAQGDFIARPMPVSAPSLRLDDGNSRRPALFDTMA